MTLNPLDSTEINNLKTKKKFYKNAVILLKNGVREIKIPDKLVDDIIIIFSQQARIAESTIAYTKYLARKPNEDDPRL